MHIYVKYFDKCNTCINLLDNDKEILEKYSKIWNQIKKLFEKKSDSEPLCNDKYIKAKINSYNANFYGNKTTIEGVHEICFFVISLDSVVKIDKKKIIHKYS